MRETIRIDDEESLGATTPEGEPGTRRQLAGQGEKIGRYCVLELLGSGGMGVVYRVYDPELDREVALKLLLVGARSGGDTHGRRKRLVREAQALAQLSHPNVVTVFDVGTIDGDPYIAMEYVVGQTLADWLATPRPWRQTLQVFLAAGRGLQAAHARGIIHRDFKLANVLVGEDGRPRVVDFGLARPAESAAGTSISGAPMSVELELGTSALVDGLTEAGVVMGTPKSMSPEQHKGLVADERSDQYSFCVALFEALFGVAPFPGTRLSELWSVKRAGKSVPIPAASPVPGVVREAVLCGLSPDPAHRWPDMDGLLQALERAAAPAPRWPWLTAVIVVAGAGWMLVPQSPEAATCSSRAVATAAWSDAAVARGRSAGGATQLPYAAASFDRAAALIGRYVEQWETEYLLTCSVAVTDDAAAALVDRRMACLKDRQREVEALSTAFQSADAAVVEHAVRAAAQLQPPQRCGELAHEAGSPAPPTDADAAVVEHERARLLEAATLQATGKYDRALALALGVSETADRLQYRPLEAEASLRIGLLQHALADAAASEAALTDAYLVSTSIGHSDVALRSATALVLVVGAEQSRFEDGHQWARHADAALAREGQDAAAREAELGTNLGELLRAEGRFAEALAHHQVALQQREAMYGDEHPDVAASLEKVARVLHDLGRMSEAIPNFERALMLRRKTLGLGHPDVARSLASLAYELYIVGDVQEAIDAQTEALSIRRRVLTADHPDIAESLSNLGRSYALMGRHEEALAAEDEALEIRRRVYGDEHPSIATSLSSIGITLHTLSRFEEGLGHQRRALEIREKSLGPQHPHTAMVLINMGFDLQGLGRNEEALAAHRRAYDIVLEAYGREHLLLTYALTGIGDAAMALHRPGDAVRALNEAVAIAESHDRDFMALGQARFALARAMWDEGVERSRALELAVQARGEFENAAEPGQSTREAVDQWLKGKRASP